MRAGVFKGVRQIPVEEIPEPTVGQRDIVLDVRACGVCGSDLHTYTAGLLAEVGQVMGHEFAGEVVGVGSDVAGIAVGDRVTALPIQPCGSCRRCREDLGHLCEVWHTRSIGNGLPGGFAERLRIPDAIAGHNVHLLPAEVSFEDGALVEPLAVAVHAISAAQPRPGQVAVVLGLGTIGLHAAQVLRARDVSVVGVDRSALRRGTAERLGLPAVGGSGSIAEAVRDHLGDAEVDLVVEATGAPQLIQQAIGLVRPRGVLAVVALYEDTASIDATAVVQKELTIRGSAMVTAGDFRAAIDLLSTGKARAQPLISHRIPLDRLTEAFETQLDKDAAVKVLITGR